MNTSLIAPQSKNIVSPNPINLERFGSKPKYFANPNPTNWEKMGVVYANQPSKDAKVNKDGDSFEMKKNADGLPKGSNQTRGLKVIDKEIQDCKREDFESDESYRLHKQMLMEERRKLVEADGDAKAKKAEANGNAASKILTGTGNLLSGAGELVGKILPFLMKA